ncbi:DUF5803 family protein [Methanofollis tationis]|uniref:Uncharacterized protein n=1 Tax=Methanofollis tationis TaxID=81417 RepID=A0A7K4HRR6_9EURY|nr:hypothetical protein [Methanofollis tationis]
MQAAAYNATVTVLPGGEAYIGEVTLTDAEEYAFWEAGMLGERLPLTVKNVTVSGECGDNCSYTQKDRNTIAFERGNVTVSYEAEIVLKNLQVLLEEPSAIAVTLPEGLNVQNPLLGRVSEGGTISQEDNATVIRWDGTRFVEVRFYDSGQERLLLIFGAVWFTVAAVLLVPFLLMRRKSGQ